MLVANFKQAFYGSFNWYTARYQPCHSVHFRSFKLATSTFVLSILDVDLYTQIPQALRFDCILRFYGRSDK